MIAANELHAPGGRVQPEKPRIAGNPRFREGYQLCTLSSGFFNQGDGFVYCSVQVHEHRSGLDAGDFDGFVHGGVPFGLLLVVWGQSL
ncbi:hypothetical protein D3C76_1092990 [compost metagenome]